MSAAVQEWCNAVDALINSTDNATRSNADKWLQFFQKKPEIWSVADQILRQPNLPQNCYYMAANALRSKLLYDFHELPDRSTRVSFFHSLMANVTNFAGGPQLVRTRLALCVASLAVHVAGSGEMPDVLSVLMQTYGSNNEYALVLLDIMTVVPEECANKKLGVSDSIRATAAQNFSAQTAVILRMIMAFLESTGTDRLLQKKVFKCFLSWVRHGGVPPEELSTNPLFGAVFDALAVQTHLDNSVTHDKCYYSLAT
jgi:transportin-3